MPAKKKRVSSKKRKTTKPRKRKIVKKIVKKKSEPIKLSDEVMSFIVAIVFFAISIVLFAARFSFAGPVGDYSYQVLELLLGVGFYLVPILFFILAISFFYNIERNFSKIKILGSSLFLIAGLTVVDLLFGAGGVIGGFIANIQLLLGKWVSVIIMLLVFISSLAIIFDAVPGGGIIQRWRDRRSAPTEVLYEEELNEDEERKIDNAAAIKQPAKKILEKPSLFAKKQPKPEVAAKAPTVKQPKEETLSQGIDTTIKKTFTAKPGDEKLPPLSMLSKDSGKPGVGDIKANANIIKRTLSNFGIEVEMDEVSVGPTVTRYSFKPAEGVKLSKIAGLQDDLALSLAAKTLRMETPIPGKSLVGIEIPNKSKTTVGLGTLLSSGGFQATKDALPMAVGKDIGGNAAFINMAKAPHMLIAGATGAGKSVTVHALITSLLFKHGPDMLKLIMVDPKRVELTLYNGIPHLLTPTITDAKSAILALKWAVKEMNRRYDILQSHSVRDIGSYHDNILKQPQPEGEEPLERMPYIVFVIDELADIMMSYPRELEAGIVALAQMSRAVGIHLILSTQRPSVNVITGLIKANIPTRIALKVASAIDSRTILDMGGAEKLLGAGDALYMTGSMSSPVRVQSAFIPEEEVKKIVSFLKKSYKDELPDEIDLSTTAVAGDNVMFAGSLDDDDEQDDLYEDAKQTVIAAGKASTSYLQRKLKVGYSRAARLMDILEERGVIGAANGSKPREVLVGNEPEEDMESSESDSEYESQQESSNTDELLDESANETEVYTPPTNDSNRF